MSQGKAWKPEEKEQIIQSLRESLELGFSRNKACEITGLTPSTLSNWVQNDDSLGMRLKGWENAVNKLVMVNLVDALKQEGKSEDSRKETSKWWAERRMKEDFSSKTETDITSDGEKISFGWVNENNDTV